MNLYKLSQTTFTGYDVYDSAVVAAESEEIARIIHPSTLSFLDYPNKEIKYIPNGNGYSNWPDDPEYITVEYLGKAAVGTPRGVICSSYNAG